MSSALTAWASPRIGQLAGVVGRRDFQTVAFVRCSLLGAAVTPPRVPLSVADNLVWLLGASVERKGHETAERYCLGADDG